jgi:hypothetical protein
LNSAMVRSTGARALAWGTVVGPLQLAQLPAAGLAQRGLHPAAKKAKIGQHLVVGEQPVQPDLDK